MLTLDAGIWPETDDLAAAVAWLKTGGFWC